MRVGSDVGTKHYDPGFAGSTEALTQEMPLDLLQQSFDDEGFTVYDDEVCVCIVYLKGIDTFLNLLIYGVHKTNAWVADIQYNKWLIWSLG